MSYLPRRIRRAWKRKERAVRKDGPLASKTTLVSLCGALAGENSRRFVDRPEPIARHKPFDPGMPMMLPILRIGTVPHGYRPLPCFNAKLQYALLKQGIDQHQLTWVNRTTTKKQLLHWLCTRGMNLALEKIGGSPSGDDPEVIFQHNSIIFPIQGDCQPDVMITIGWALDTPWWPLVLRLVKDAQNICTPSFLDLAEMTYDSWTMNKQEAQDNPELFDDDYLTCTEYWTDPTFMDNLRHWWRKVTWPRKMPDCVTAHWLEHAIAWRKRMKAYHFEDTIEHPLFREKEMVLSRDFNAVMLGIGEEVLSKELDERMEADMSNYAVCGGYIEVELQLENGVITPRVEDRSIDFETEQLLRKDLDWLIDQAEQLWKTKPPSKRTPRSSSTKAMAAAG